MTDTRRRHPEEERILAGGQGRDTEEIAESADVLMWCALVVLTAMLLVTCGGCAKPSAYARGESSACERPDRPRWDKLRQQIGGL